MLVRVQTKACVGMAGKQISDSEVPNKNFKLTGLTALGGLIVVTPEKIYLGTIPSRSELLTFPETSHGGYLFSPWEFPYISASPAASGEAVDILWNRKIYCSQIVV